MTKCNVCKGFGAFVMQPVYEKCMECDGEGAKVVSGRPLHVIQCMACNGSGELLVAPGSLIGCTACEGKGEV